MTPRPTMRDVAQLAGEVHPSTVSLALRNSPRVSQKVREKIQVIARRIGYRRDPLLDAFNQHRLKIVPQRAARHIAAISDFSSMAELMASPSHASARAGAIEAAARLHCQLDFFFCGNGQPHPRRLDAVLEARGLRALLIFAVKADATTLDFTWARTCSVAVDSMQLTLPFYRVTPDFREATRLLWRRAWTQGCQRIAILRSDSIHPATEDRAVAGFLLEQLRHPSATPIPVFTLVPDCVGKKTFTAWLHNHRPQTILHSSALTSSLAALLDGEAVRCVAFDALSPDEPGICPDYAEVGRRAVEQLVTLMQTNQLGLPQAAVCTYVPVNFPS
jgi:LacI family transcriptional regulator